MAQYLIFQILNPEKAYPQSENAPYFINVFWDDVSQSVQADYRPVRNISADRVGEISNYQFCDNTTLNRFELTRIYPYAVRQQVTNSPACTFAPSCDAHIQAPLIIKKSKNGLNNGSVTIRGTSTAPLITGQSTFSYSIVPPVWQGTPTIYPLPPGNYSAYIQDANGCQDAMPFTIEEEPLYGLRFYSTYKTIGGATTLIRIFKRDYTLAAEEVRSGPTPLIFKERANALFDVIRGQECQINLLASVSGQFLELYTGDRREYRVEVYRDEVLFWSGWLAGEVYTEPYIAPPYVVSFSATDGLGELKNEPFADRKPSGTMTQWEILFYCLEKTGIDRALFSGINLYEMRMFRGEQEEPLKQAAVNLEAYFDGIKTLSCAAVLTAILKPYGAYIRQYKGAWHLIRVEENMFTYIRREYNENGDFVAFHEYNPARPITGPHANTNEPFFWVSGNQQLELTPAYSSATTHLNYGLRDNILPGGDFHPDDFIADPNGVYHHRFIDGTAESFRYFVDNKGNFAALLIPGAVTDPATADYIQTERVWVREELNLSLKLSIEFQLITLAAGGSGNPAQLRFDVKLNDKWLQWPVQVSGNMVRLDWGAAYTQHNINTTTFNSFQTMEIITAAIPEDGWLTVRIFQATSGGYPIFGMLLKKIGIAPFQTSGPALDSEETYLALNSRRYFFTPETEEATHGEVIPHENAPAMYRNLILINGKPSLGWNRREGIEELPILDMLTASRLFFNQVPPRLLRGSLRGNMEWNQVIQEPATGTRYMPVSFEYNDRENIITGEFIELLGTSTGSIISTYEYNEAEYNEAEYN